MRCTECSQQVRPVVALDIDGTLGDYHAHFMRFASAYLGRGLSMEYQGHIGFKWWACETWGIDERTWHDIKLAYRQGAQKRSMPVHAAARDLCDGVWLAGAEVWLTTTRPYLRLDNVDPDTRHWLYRHNIHYDGLIYDEHKYIRLGEYVDHDRVVAVVDDEAEMYDEAAAVFGSNVPILFMNKYNEATPREHYAKTLIGVLGQVNIKLNYWKEET